MAGFGRKILGETVRQRILSTDCYGVTTGWPDGLPDGSYPGALGYIDVAAVRAAYPATAT